MTVSPDPCRDSYALGLAWLDEDMERVMLLLEPYDLDRMQRDLLLFVLDLTRLDPDKARLLADIQELAIEGARRPDELEP